MNKIKMPEIDAKRFYMIGKFAFFTMALLGCVRILDMFSQLKSYEIFSSLASAIFYFVLSAFFSKLQGDEDVKEVKDGDIIKMNEALKNLELEELNTKEVKNAKKNSRRL